MLGWELPPHNSGGLGVACYQLCQALSAQDIAIEFILPYTAEHSVDFMQIRAAHPQDVSEVIKAGIAYDSFKYVKTNGTVQWVDLFGQTKLYERSVERLVRSSDFDVIHAHDWLTFKAALRAKQLSGKPLILHVHSVEADRSGAAGKGNPLVREIEGLSLLGADRIIAVSHHTKKAIMREYHIPAHKIEVIHNSIDVKDLAIDPDDSSYRYLLKMKSQGYRVVVNIGRITIQKGLANLLRAAQSVVARAPKTLFLFVGNGDQERELLELSAALGISRNVLFAGFQRGKRWRDAYIIGDLFVMPSISEPFGLTPLEAIGYGTPALISKQSGVSEVIRNCLKVDYWDINEMANQITAVVQNQGLQEELHTQAYTEYQRLSWSDSAAKLARLYTEHAHGVPV